MKIRDFIYSYTGVDGKKIRFYCFNTGETVVTDIENLFEGNEFDGILECELEGWEFEPNGICIMYFND